MKQLLLSLIVIITFCYNVTSYAEREYSKGEICNAIAQILVNEDLDVFLAETKELRPEVLQLALRAYACAKSQGIKVHSPILTIIDYSLPSTERRLWVLDIAHNKVLFHSLVTHGKYSGRIIAKHFSNQPGTDKSSIGLFITKSTYYGHDGYSLRIAGLDKGFNDEAKERRIVIHGAWYVSEKFIHKYGRLGRSWGCPALNLKWVKPIINTIKDGTLIFAYYPNQQWLTTSKFLQC